MPDLVVEAVEEERASWLMVEDELDVPNAAEDGTSPRLVPEVVLDEAAVRVPLDVAKDEALAVGKLVEATEELETPVSALLSVDERVLPRPLDMTDEEPLVSEVTPVLTVDVEDIAVPESCDVDARAEADDVTAGEEEDSSSDDEADAVEVEPGVADESEDVSDACIEPETPVDRVVISPEAPADATTDAEADTPDVGKTEEDDTPVPKLVCRR